MCKGPEVGEKRIQQTEGEVGKEQNGGHVGWQLKQLGHSGAQWGTVGKVRETSGRKAGLPGLGGFVSF